MSSSDARLRVDGVAGWPDAVAPDRVERALRAIHRNMFTRGLPVDRMPEFENATYCPELRGDPDILGLFRGTRLEAEAERLLGPLEAVERAQIALRFPQADDAPAPVPHLDGVSAPHNGVPCGTIMTFSALAGVYLSDVGPEDGAFTVWPGSHRAHAAHFAQHGPESLLAGMPRTDIQPRPVVGGPGFGFIANYLVGHAIGRHRGSRIRYAVFFRLRARGHQARGRRVMLDPWLEWRL